MFKSFGNFNKKKAAIYIRVSTLTQVKDGYGMDVQEKTCSNVCKMKGFEIYNVYIDDGVSGTKKASERKGMSRLMKDGLDKNFDVVVFSSLDRIGREIILTFEIIKFFTDNNIEFFSCKEAIDNFTYQGKFKLSIYAAVSELELNTIKARLTMGREMKKKKYGDIGGRMPYGYIRQDGEITIKTSEVLVIRGIFKASYENKISMNQIAKILNIEKVTTPRNGKKWYASTVKSILNNHKKYEGILINDNESNIYWPNILKNKYL